MPEKSDLEPNKGKALDITVNGRSFRRYSLRTQLVNDQTKLAPFVTDRLKRFFTMLVQKRTHKNLAALPWYLFISEKIVAITQGRSYFIWDIKPGLFARLLSHFVVKTPHGIGLGSPWTMELAIREAGLPRILFAALGGVVGKLLGRKGWFYNLAGSDVRAIDGPTEYSVYPSNVSAKLPPKNPGLVAEELTAVIKKELPPELTANFRGVVVIDANDLGRNVLGHNVVMSTAELEAIFADNPLGQGSERTPLCAVFDKEESPQ